MPFKVDYLCEKTRTWYNLQIRANNCLSALTSLSTFQPCYENNLDEFINEDMHTSYEKETIPDQKEVAHSPFYKNYSYTQHIL